MEDALAQGPDPFATSRLERERYRKKLNRLLGCAEDEAFHILVWAVAALQSDQEQVARRHLAYPRSAASARLGDQAYIPGWDMETLLNERLALPPLRLRPSQRNRVMDCRRFNALAHAVDCLRKLENAETGLVLKRMNVLREMPRIGHRQFEWQRGFFNGPQVYRWPYLFSGPQCGAYFRDKTGVSISEFVRYGLALYSLFEQQPKWSRVQLLDLPTFDPSVTGASLRLLSATIGEARDAACKLRKLRKTTAYQPSQYRRSPVIGFGAGEDERLAAPLRELILVRITSGLYYDIADAPSSVRNEVGERFEAYCRELLAAALPRLQVSPGPTYRFRQNNLAGPDLVVREGERVAMMFECKARKMSFAARFSEDPLADAGGGFEELAKGVAQLWKARAHARMGLTPDTRLDDQTVTALLTLDNWMSMSGELQLEVRRRAAEIAAERYPEVVEGDRAPVVFCSIEDVELTLARADQDRFLEDLRAATEERFTGWLLPNIHRDSGEPAQERPYPFAGRIGQVLPWWDEMLATREP